MKFLQNKGKALDQFMVFDLVWVTLMGMLLFQNSSISTAEVQPEKQKTYVSEVNAFMPTLNCINNVNVSISQFGTSLLTPGYFVNAIYPNFAALQLSIVGRPSPIITCDDVGHYLTAVVYDPIDNQTCSTSFLVEDKMPPVFLCATTEVPCGIDIYNIQPPYTELVTVTDNCTNPPTVTILSHSESYYNCPSPYTFEIVRTYKATDASGNSSTCTDTVRFLRPIVDSIVFPNDTTMSCESFSSDTSVTGEPTWMGYPLRGVCYTWYGYTDQLIPMGCEGRFKIRRIWTVMDECNNDMRRDTQNIMSIDTTAPVLTCPDSLVINTSQDLCVAHYTFPAIPATDNCSSTITYQYKVDGLLVFTPSVSLSIGSHTIDVIANDGCNNTSTCSYVVTVEDHQGPNLTCHNINVGLNNIENGLVCADSLGFDYFDNCSGPLTISIRKLSSSIYTDCVTYTCAEIGSNNTLIFQVCDQYGNCTTCSVTVTVQDTEPPTINCGPAIPVNLTCFEAEALDPEDYLPVVTDNCGTPVITYDVDNDLNCNHEGTITITYTATDGSGNAVSCDKIFNVTNPNTLSELDIIWPPDLDMAGCNPNVNDTSITGYPVLIGDFCNEIDISSSLVDTTTNMDGCAVIVKEYVVIDSCVFGLSGGLDGKFIHQQFITVTGATAPVLTIPGDITVEPTNVNNCTADIDLPLATATGCGLPIIITNDFNNGGADASGIYPFGVTEVIYTATNICGVESTDTLTVTVEYLSNDLLICPAPFTISCLMEFNPNNLPGPTIMNVCGTYDVDTLITGTIAVCGNSTLTVTYSILTNDGRTDQCSFNITVEGATPLTEDNIDWPETPLTVECDASIDPFVIGSFPVIDVGAGCTISSIGFEDSPSTPIDVDACSAIDRLWTVIDSCNFDPNTQEGVFTFLQHIDIIDNTAPQLVNFNDGDTIFAPLYIDDCKRQVDLSNLILSDCNPIAITTNDFVGAVDNNSLDASGFFTLGTVDIHYYVEDACGNGDSFTLTIAVVDSFPPTWPCPDSLDIFLDPSGLDTVLASDFSYEPFLAFDNCNFFNIFFTFDSTDLSDSLLYLACSSTPGALSIQNIEIFVYDQVGLYTSCIVDLNVLVPEGQTTDCTHPMGIIGEVEDELGRPVSNAEIHADGEVNYMDMTNTSGDYQITDIPPGADLTVTGKKTDQALKGVNTNDVIAIRDHILGKSLLNSPYKLLAGDVNADESMSVRDLIEIRKLILGKISHFSSNASWKFADKGYHFANKKNPFNQPAVYQRELQNVIGMMPVVNFIGLKLGDVNNTALANIGSDEIEIRNDQPLYLYSSLVEENDEEIRIRLSGDQIREMRGFQFELNFDTDILQFVNFEKGNLSGFSEDNYNTENSQAGELSFSWDDEIENTGETIGVLIFKKLKPGKVSQNISINDTRIEAQAYDTNAKVRPLELLAAGKWDGQQVSAGKMLQNSPNPFYNKTNINILLTQATEGKLTVYDVTGRPIYVKSASFDKGLNVIEIKSSELNGSGIYIYKFESDVFTDTKKMILTL